MFDLKNEKVVLIFGPSFRYYNSRFPSDRVPQSSLTLRRHSGLSPGPTSTCPRAPGWPHGLESPPACGRRPKRFTLPGRAFLRTARHSRVAPVPLDACRALDVLSCSALLLWCCCPQAGLPNDSHPTYPRGRPSLSSPHLRPSPLPLPLATKSSSPPWSSSRGSGPGHRVSSGSPVEATCSVTWSVLSKHRKA